MSCYDRGFRLNDAVSECSMRSKARIDSLFEDTRSICSSSYGDLYGSIYGQTGNLEDVNVDAQKKINGAVQARIEAMFASVEAEAGEKGECAAAILPVKYLGAAPVGGRIASVRGLQEPLRQLLERMDTIVSAELEVSRRGLTFRTPGSIEKTNPFRRIAVWSALRLRVRRLASPTLVAGDVGVATPDEYHHAFIPLIGDDQVPGSEDKHADLYRTMRGLATDVSRYPPLFAVVMRRPGAARVLECHVFACSSEEEAVAAAATLYRALLADLDSNRRRPRQTNGLGCVSLASAASSIADYTSIASKNTYNNLPPKALAPHPVRPPRSKKNSLSGSVTDGGSSRSINSGKVIRRKKTSEIRSEDVAEARKRHSQMVKDSRCVLKELRDDTGHLSCQENNREVKRRNSINRNSNEGINNMRNKIYSGKVNGIEKIQDENELHSRIINDYDKMTRKDNKGGFEVDKNYCFIERNGNNIVGEVVNMPEAQLYERNQCSYDLNINSSRSEIYSERFDAHRGKQEACQALKSNEDSSKSCDNSIYGRSTRNPRNRSKAYEDHFKDVDKIYTLSQEDVKVTELKRNSVASSVASSLRHDADKSNRGLKKDKHDAARRNSRHQECAYQTERLQRASRIDGFSKKQVCNSSDAFTSDSSYPKCRKRDRAGSEPPISRTENAAKISQGIKLKRSVSDIEVERGDLLTRVELPRRGSFLKSSSTRLPANVHGGTPLGFTELFDEFRNQEGLTSVDDILDVIIDPEGMSFNELKPLYKEFLLKLASTLTQDELYQRSANIMKRRRRPQRRRSTRKSSLLGRAIRRSVSKLKTGPTEFTSVIFPARKFSESFDSSSSCDVRNSRNRVLASRLSRRKSSWRKSSKAVNSEDSDTCKRVARSAGANRSSSGYVSCSECSYDSESCTCVSADKCYCSLPRRSPGQQVTAVNNLVVCSCDTDSCSESNKCYCAKRPVTQPTILEQLRQRGIIPSESTISRDGSLERARIIKNSRSHSSSQSLEYHKMRPSPVRSSSDNLALDYDLFSPGKKSQQSKSNNEKVLVVSARDPHGRLIYVGGANRNKKSFSNGGNRPGANQEAMSIKKTAEIAAVFGPESIRSCKRTSSTSSMRSSVSLEAGLGYLP